MVHNTLYHVAAQHHAGVIFNLSPKTAWPGREVAEPNRNVTFANNVVVMAPGSSLPVVEMRIMQVGVLPWYSSPDRACCCYSCR